MKTNKPEQKRLLIEMMREDEKSGMYEKSDNELIAEFMGYNINYESHNAPVIYYPDGDYSYISDAGFKLYWDRLIPVVEKIESLGYDVDICGQNCMISEGTPQGDGGKYFRAMIDIDKPPKITAVYEAVVEFIWWYNSQQHERK